MAKWLNTIFRDNDCSTKVQNIGASISKEIENGTLNSELITNDIGLLSNFDMDDY